MRKVLLTVLLVTVLMVTGCSSSEETKTLTCTRNATVTTGVRMELSYKATYKGDYVELIETEEKVISDNESVLDTYKTSIESLYSPYKDVEYYNYSVDVSGDTLTSKTRIDYSKIDTDKLIEIDSANASLIKDGKIKIDDIRTMYESAGATCK